MRTRVPSLRTTLPPSRTAAAAALGGALCCAFGAALAQDASGGVKIDVSRCIELQSAEQRFACYEAQVRATGRATGEPAAAAPSPAAPTFDRAAPSAPAASAPAPAASTSAASTPAAPTSAASTSAASTSAAARAPGAAPPTVTSAATAPPVVSIEASPSSASAAHERADRGSRSRRDSAGAAAREELATITALRQREPNQYLISLDNGEVWLQTVPTSYVLQIGDEVKLRSTPWGDNWRLTAGKLRGFIQVKRVQ